ncbi:MAG: phosphoribosylanthranilate isomerase [Melioribacter sp.]|nr:phosphoribosylanthranilate isomerase [Melioribacter sp.]
MRVKICGITNIEDALYCCKLGADALGFVFYKNSKRFIDYSEAKNIIKSLPPFISKVGVFVNTDYKEINEVAEKIGLTLIQLHGDETFDLVNKIKLPVIKSFRIKNDFDFSILDKYPNCYYLFDSFSENEFGGTGKNFNWDLIPNELKTKIILAGGISTENIEFIYKNIKPMAVDLSSSVEITVGKKSYDKLKKFFSIVNKLRFSY